MANVNTFSTGPHQAFISQGVYGTLSVTDTPALAKVGSTNFSGRNVVIVYNASSDDTIYWGFDASVSSSNGLAVPPSMTGVWAISDGVNLYFVAAAGKTISARIVEGF